MRRVNGYIVIVFAAFTAGCTYVPVLHSTPATNQSSGLVYALPKAQFQIDAVRKTLGDDDLASAQTAANSAKAVLDAANKNVTDATAALSTAQSNVNALKDSDPPTLKEKLEADRILATILLRARVAEAETAKIRSSEAAKRLAQVSANLGKMEQSVSLKSLPAAPDHRYRYTVVLDTSLLRDDNIKLTVASGMLNSTTSEATGQAGSVLVNLVSSIAGARSPGIARMSRLADPKSGCNEFAKSWIFDPTDMADVTAVAYALHNDSQGTLKLKHEGKDVDLQSRIAQPGSKSAVAVAKYEKVPGLAYRAPRVTTIEVDTQKSANCTVQTNVATATLTATVPDSDATYHLPVEAGAFTKSKVDYAFKDGMPITFTHERPSQAVAIARLPVDVLKAIVEVPASIVKLRVDYDSQANALIEAESKNQKAQLDLLKAQRELNDAQAGE